MKNRVKITIDGKSFTLVGEETEIHMQQVAEYIDQKMLEIRQNASAVIFDSSLAYVLTSINVADDYFKEKAHTAELENKLLEMTEKIKELTKLLEEVEKQKDAAETKLDEYALAMKDGIGVQMQITSAKTKKGK